MNDLIEKYCREQSEILARKIDEEFFLTMKCPAWCPQFLFKFVCRNFVNIVNIKK